MGEQSFVETAGGVKRGIDQRRCFRRVGWTFWGSLIVIPSNRDRRGEHLPDDPSHQFLILNSLVILLALPVLGKSCFGGRGAREKNRQPHHPLVLLVEREIICTVRTSHSECARGMHGKCLSYLAGILTKKPAEDNAHTAAKPTKNNVGESKTSRRGVSFRYFRDLGRSDDGYRVFDVRATREYRDIRSGSSDCPCADPKTGPKNKCSEQKSYLIPRTNRCLCFPLQSASRRAVRCGGGYISHNDSIDKLRALLDRWSILLLKKRSYNHRFVPQVHPAARDVSIGTDCGVSVSIFGDQNWLNARYWTILPPRIPPSASLTDVGVRGESEERLSTGIVREGFITSWKEAVFEDDFRITTGHVIGTATNWRESSQSELYRICLNFNELVSVLLRLGRKSFCHHPETQIRICRMEEKGFHDVVNQHPLNINHWLNDSRSRGNRDKYVDLQPNVYEWSDRAGGSRVFARYSMTKRRNHSMTVYDRLGFTTGQDPIGRWGYSMKYVKLYFICERLDIVIHEFEDADSPTIVHLETICGVSGNHKPSQSPDELEASSPNNDRMVVDRFITDLLPRRNEPDAECAAGVMPPTGGDTTPAMPGRYNRVHTAKRRIYTTGSLPCYRDDEANTTTPRSSDRLHLLGCKRRPSPYHCNRAGGIIENNSIAYRQSRNLLYVRVPPTFADDGRRLILPDRYVISIIQSQISDYILYPNHPPQDRDRPFAIARNACELFLFYSAQTNSLLLRGKTTRVDPTRHLSITKPFHIKRMGNLGVIAYCRPHACAEVLTPTAGTGGCPADSRDGKGVSSSGGGQYRTDKGIVIQTKSEETLDYIRELSAGSSTDLASLIGRGFVAEESTAEFYSFKDETYSKNYPALPRPNDDDPVVEGTDICVAGDQNNAFGEYQLFRSYTPPCLSTRKLWKYWGGIIPETFEKNASSRSNDRTNSMNVRGFDIDQPSCRPTIQRLSRNNCNNKYPTMGSPPLALPVLVKGSSYIDPRRRLAVIRFVMDASRKYRLDRSMLWGMIHHPIGWPDDDDGFFPPTTNIKCSVKNIGYFIRTRERTNGWADSSKSLDLYPTGKVLLIEFMMKGEHIYRNELSFPYNHNFLKNDSGHRIAQEQGLYYSRYLARSYDNGIAHYLLRHSDSRNFISLALWQRVTPSNHTYRIPPVQVRSGLSSPSRGIPPIGSAETGRSYPMNDLAADFDAHSIPISTSDFYEDERDLTADDIRMNCMKLLSASLCRFIPFLELIEKKPPRVIWIRYMHELGFKGERFARAAGTGTKFAYRSLSILSAGFATCTPSMIVTGPTYPPGEMDPPLIRANRSDRLTDVRALSIPRRQKEFPALLRSKRFNFLLEDDNLSCLSAFAYIIMCDYARDSASPAHEALLVGISHSVFPGHAIGSVLLRKVVPEHDVCMDTGSHYYDKYVYRVGRAVAHSTVIGIIPTIPSSYGSEMKDPSERKLDSLSAWYLEPSIADSTAREFTRLLSRVSGSLVGSARRYSWPVANDQQRRYDSNNSVRSSAEYDSISARSAASENIVAESPWLEETRKGESASGEVGFAPRPHIRTPPAWNAILAVPSPVLDEEGFGMTNETTARPPTPPVLLPAAISHLSDWVQTAYARGKLTLAHPLMHDSVIHVLRNPLCYAHKRISFQRLSIMIKGAESQSESMPPSKDRPIILGVYIPTGCIGCQQPNQSVLSIGKRFVWDGSLSRDCTFTAFSHQPRMDQGELVLDRGGSTMPKGLHAVRRNNIGFCGGADQQFYAHETDDVVPRVVAAGKSTAEDRSSGIDSDSPGGGRRPSVDMLKRTDNSGVRSEHTHLFHPVYSYQARAFFESPSDTFARSESPNHERWWLGEVGSPPQYPPTHSTLPESHRYSLKKHPCSQ
uniref:Hypothetical chloroplast RF21 n=1 Tax=Selaginella doederleinii TaxID=186426 RepID=A0A482CHZ5_9TRAC|nr:hypothetical chloroplast RF21 [Selaginella doederleinii]QBL76024.1 hypothetical chloroplast RF21 [Selaginella doederleinii]